MFSRFRFSAFVVLLMAVLSECQSSGGLSMVEEEGVPSAVESVTTLSSQLPVGIRERLYIQTVLMKELNALAFGQQAWADYFGDVGKEPPLPSRIFRILNGDYPFWAGLKVRDTHALVLIPASVGGRPFTLDLLGELITPRFPDNARGYRFYSSGVCNEFGNETLPDAPYWLLMTRDVIPGSRRRTYADQEALVAGHARGEYRLPYAIEAATVILMHYVKNNGERLYSDDPETHTRCVDTQLVDRRSPIAVGGFESSGLYVDYHYSHDSDDNFNGVAGCWKL